jgi:glyoxylase-like metal-dependent hydrolase (beta-lactamase superfamily II)
MTLKIETYVLGPMGNNTYLLGDDATREAVIIDPSFDCQPLLSAIEKEDWSVHSIWLTHGHFDHIAGIPELVAGLPEPPVISLHQDDHMLYQMGGGADFFGVNMPPMPAASQFFTHDQTLNLGGSEIEVSHTPGHSLGHVIFYCPEQEAVLSGDLVFKQSIGRSDLPGGNHNTLIHSIRNHILTLPTNTRILSGHGPETTVVEEQFNNPFLRE